MASKLLFSPADSLPCFCQNRIVFGDLEYYISGHITVRRRKKYCKITSLFFLFGKSHNNIVCNPKAQAITWKNRY